MISVCDWCYEDIRYLVDFFFFGVVTIGWSNMLILTLSALFFHVLKSFPYNRMYCLIFARISKIFLTLMSYSLFYCYFYLFFLWKTQILDSCWEGFAFLLPRYQGLICKHHLFSTTAKTHKVLKLQIKSFFFKSRRFTSKLFLLQFMRGAGAVVFPLCVRPGHSFDCQMSSLTQG